MSSLAYQKYLQDLGDLDSRIAAQQKYAESYLSSVFGESNELSDLKLRATQAANQLGLEKFQGEVEKVQGSVESVMELHQGVTSIKDLVKMFKSKASGGRQQAEEPQAEEPQVEEPQVEPPAELPAGGEEGNLPIDEGTRQRFRDRFADDEDQDFSDERINDAMDIANNQEEWHQNAAEDPNYNYDVSEGDRQFVLNERARIEQQQQEVEEPAQIGDDEDMARQAAQALQGDNAEVPRPSIQLGNRTAEGFEEPEVDIPNVPEGSISNVLSNISGEEEGLLSGLSAADIAGGALSALGGVSALAGLGLGIYSIFEEGKELDEAEKDEEEEQTQLNQLSAKVGSQLNVFQSAQNPVINFGQISLPTFDTSMERSGAIPHF